MKNDTKGLVAATTLVKLCQVIDNQTKTTAVLRRWTNGKIQVHETPNYDPKAPVTCVAMVEPETEIGADFEF